MARKVARSKSSLDSITPPAVVASRSRTWKKRIALVGSGVAVLVLAFAIKNFVGNEAAVAQIPNPFRGRPGAQPGDAKTQAAGKAAGQGVGQASQAAKPQHDVMAVVNGQDIRRDALAAACVERFGKEMLEGLVNKRLIQHHCRNRGIDVTEPEIDAEIDRLTTHFKIPRQQYLEMLEKERGINVQQYRRDIVWPMLALRKLAAKDLEVSEQQIEQAYESNFGPSVQCRLIVVRDRNLAEQLQRQVAQQPSEFARLAMKHSQDVNSASNGGMILPIYRFQGDLAIERAVFALQPNGVTPVIPVAEQFAIFKCERQIPPRNVPMASVRNELVEKIREEKLQDVAGALFAQFEKSATIQKIWNDPQLRAANPGVVATINGDTIRYQELADECLLRYGKQVLEVEITHLLLQQTLVQTNTTITQEELNAEIANAAKLAGKVDPQGRPLVQEWVKLVLEEQDISEQIYLRDIVWPSAALKKLTGASVEVTEADMKKGYDANFGERVRCRAIVLPTMRSAQEVWDKARQKPTPEYFGDLAAEFSVEPQSKGLRGEVPPIGRNEGSPQLEKVAFDLQPGELSGVVQQGNHYVILLCEGRTQPTDVNQATVNEILYRDIFEKKQRIAMSERLEKIQAAARIDNFLAGTSKAPEKVKADPVASGPRVDSAVRPVAGGMPGR